MTTVDFIIELFCRIDDAMKEIVKHSQASLYPSELVTLAFLFAIKGVGNRPFYRWLTKDFIPLFPNLPERTRLFRLFKTHRRLTERFLAEATVLGVIDSYGIELIHPILLQLSCEEHALSHYNFYLKDQSEQNCL